MSRSDLDKTLGDKTSGKPLDKSEPTDVKSDSGKPSSSGQSFMSGTFWVFLAEALIFPTGLVTAGILTRNLGQDGYGVLTLVSWVEWTITSFLRGRR